MSNRLEKSSQSLPSMVPYQLFEEAYSNQNKIFFSRKARCQRNSSPYGLMAIHHPTLELLSIPPELAFRGELREKVLNYLLRRGIKISTLVV
ncbi:MAG: hypothetical protein ABSF09_02500 [Candidatus Bathyarchaeia archaeon]